MGDGSSAHLHGVVMLTGPAASSTSFSLGQDDSLHAVGNLILPHVMVLSA